MANSNNTSNSSSTNSAKSTNSTNSANSSSTANTSRLPQDLWLRRIMLIGLPMGLLTIILLWGTYFTGQMWMLQSFIGLAALTFAAGVAYNVRLVMVLARERRREKE